MPRCSIIIPVHNKASLTRQCVNALLAQREDSVDFEIIVANSDSGRVQEAHTVILHALLDVIERNIAA